MPNAPRIDRFNYDPGAKDAAEDVEVREASTNDVEATHATEDPLVDPKGGN
jgi:hypothetical protein